MVSIGGSEILVGCFILAVISIVGGLLYARRERILTHQERMRALELGHQIPDDSAAAQIRAVTGASDPKSTVKSPSQTCYSTAFWVAFWGFIAASGHGGWSHNPSVAITIGVAVAVVSGISMICGTILAVKFPEGSAPTTPTYARTKPLYEPDAFDVVGSRG